jgi:hypothetical protein
VDVKGADHRSRLDEIGEDLVHLRKLLPAVFRIYICRVIWSVSEPIPRSYKRVAAQPMASHADKVRRVRGIVFPRNGERSCS